MSEQAEFEQVDGEHAGSGRAEIERVAATEVIGAPLPAPIGRRGLARTPAGRGLAAVSTLAPAAQAAAVAAGGFVAGAAIVGLAGRRRARARPRPARGRRAIGGGLGGVEIVGTRSLLLDVHLLSGPGGNR